MSLQDTTKSAYDSLRSINARLDARYKPHTVEWHDKAQQLLYNLSVNSEYLLRTHTLDTIIELNNETLSENFHDVDVKRRIEDMKNYNTLLERQFGDLESRTIQCRRCGPKSKVTWEIKQTRSADEGSTIFCVCLGCQTRWKM